MDRYQFRPRRFLLAAAMTAAVACAGAGPVSAPARADDIGASQAGLIHGLLPTVVNIAVQKDDPAKPAATTDASAATPAADSSSAVKIYVGSGFVIDPSGLIVTNYHVVEDAFEITVTFSDGSRLAGKMLSASRLADIAIVQVKPDHNLTAAHWGDSEKLQVGDQVFAMGDPFGIGLSVSAGIVSALNRDIQDSPYDDFIQTDATINHGNSGGPLFNMQGDVIGVNSTIISPTSGSVGIGFAIPSSSARFVVDQLLKYGWVHPAWIGVKVQAVTREIADAMGMAQPEGSIVAWVLADGPAKKAGLEIGDVILRFNGVAPTDDRALLRAIAHSPAEQEITLLVLRQGKDQNIIVTTEAWPRNQWDARDAPVQVVRPKITVPPNLGLTLSVLPTDDKSKAMSQAGLTGVLVAGVAANSDAAQKGLASGDVILRVLDKAVASPDDVKASIQAARADKRDYVLMLVLPKKSDVPGPKWVALRVGVEGG